MKRRLLPLILLAVAAIIVALLVLLPKIQGPHTLSGYVEGEPLYLAAPVAGVVKAVHVVRGQVVKAGQPLFQVDPAQVRAQLDQATAEASAAQAQAQDARRGQRPVELAILDANIAASEARARDAEAVLNRVEHLVRQGIYAPARLDNARAAAQAAQAQARRGPPPARRRRPGSPRGPDQGGRRPGDQSPGRSLRRQRALVGCRSECAGRRPG